MRTSGPPADLDPALDAMARAAAVRGSLLFHLFLAEAMAGDALADAALGEVQGWAVDVGAEGYEVNALHDGDVVRRVTFAPDGAPLVDAARSEASPRLRRLAAAREAAAQAARDHPQRYAALVAPPPRDGREARELEAYLVRLPDRSEDVALGPHWRLRLSGDMAEVREAALICGTDAAADVDGRDAPLAVTHAQTPVPSELHVFLSLRHGLALEVATPASRRRWRVDGEAVTAL